MIAERKPELAELVKIPVEFRLIFECIASNPDEKKIRKIIAEENPDMKFFWKLIQKHEVLPVVARTFGNFSYRANPGATFSNFRNKASQIAFKNNVFEEELLRIIEALQTHTIPVIPYKGAVIARYVYGDPFLRPYGDLDILIRKNDYYSVKQVMAALGYMPLKKESEEQEKNRLEEDCENAFTFQRNGLDITLDVHWNLMKKFQRLDIPFEKLWNEGRKVNFRGREIVIFSPEDTFITLVMHHGLKHLWEDLKGIQDIFFLLKDENQIDQNKLIYLARELKVEKLLYVGCLLAARIFNCQLPTVIQEKIEENPELEKIVFLKIQSITSFRFDTIKPANLNHQQIQSAIYRDGLKDKLLVFSNGINNIFKPNILDKNVIKLPVYLSFLYYVIRPFRVLISWGPVSFFQKMKDYFVQLIQLLFSMFRSIRVK